MTGGALSGRRLGAVPKGVRPTSDRVRESLFAWLSDCEGCAVLDLYAGTGALGIEALSRGARCAHFVERSRPVLSALRANLDALGITERATVQAGPAVAAVRRLGRAGQKFDLALLDPPYAGDEASSRPAQLVSAGILAPRARVVVEHSRRHPLPEIAGLALVEERRYGETALALFSPVTGGSPGRGEHGPLAEESGGSKHE